MYSYRNIIIVKAFLGARTMRMIQMLLINFRKHHILVKVD